MIYRLSEIFYSLQGEGFLQGMPVVFIRLGGCNLRCSFCDTAYAFEPRQEASESEILKRIGRYPCRRVCITGGEPFLQEIGPLAALLKSKGYWITAETNGTLWQQVDLDWLTVSPKTGGIEMHDRGYDTRFRAVAKEFKYVITRKADFDFIDKAIAQPVVLQPVNNRLSVASMIEDHLKQWPGEKIYLRLQNHKITGIR